MSLSCSFGFAASAFAEPQREHRLVTLTDFLLYAPLLVIAEGWFQPHLLCIDPHLVHDERDLTEVDGADAFQIENAPKPPFLVFLLGQHPDVHQHIHRRWHCWYMALCTFPINSLSFISSALPLMQEAEARPAAS